MLSSDARVVRGLSIANIILSSLAIVGAVITLAFTVLTVVALNDPSVIGAVEGSLSASDLNELRSYGMSEDEMLSVTGGLIGIFGGFFGVWLLISGVVTLIAGIIDLRSCGKNEKLKGAFVWAIVGAAMAFLRGSIITTVLFIVAAVYLNKLKKAAEFPYGQAGMYGQTSPYGQAQTYSQPLPYGQAAAYGQADAYGQPIPPQPYGQTPQQPAPYAQPQPQQHDPQQHDPQQPSVQPQQPCDPSQNTPSNPQA